VTFGFTEEEHAQVLEAFPEVSAFTIPAGTYTGQTEDQQSVAMWNFAIAHQDMPESLAYEITKLVLENNDRMMQIHAAASRDADRELGQQQLPAVPPRRGALLRRAGHRDPG
jgi:uncharacterized protein